MSQDNTSRNERLNSLAAFLCAFLPFAIIAVWLCIHQYVDNVSSNTGYAKTECYFYALSVEPDIHDCYNTLMNLSYMANGKSMNSTYHSPDGCSKKDAIDNITNKYKIGDTLTCYYYETYPSIIILNLNDVNGVFIASIVLLAWIIISICAIILICTKVSKDSERLPQ